MAAKLLEEKILRLQGEPGEKDEGAVLVVFRKPTGNERIQRRFLKTDKIERLYDYIDILAVEGNKAGFEVASG
jgi:UBX domain